MPSQPFVISEQDAPLEAWNDPIRGVVTWRTLLSGDRTPTEDLTLGVAEVREQAGAAVRLHRHAQGEAYHVLSGRGVMHIDDVEYPLSPGATAFIPGGAWHAARGVGPEPLRILYVFATDSFSDVVYEFRGDDAPA